MSFYEEVIRNLNVMRIEEQISFLRQKSVFKMSMKCEYCGVFMVETKYTKIKDNYVWKCLHKTCDKYKTTKSIRCGSFLNVFDISIDKIIEILYRFSQEEQLKTISNDLKIALNIIMKLYSKLWRYCHDYMRDNPIIL
ncbi:hypothetical protein DMUE_2583 [Dictyocoela muelleri]|nr:hypothetical protein DMUE_2583 [Dictyocoela muelleri]